MLPSPSQPPSNALQITEDLAMKTKALRDKGSPPELLAGRPALYGRHAHKYKCVFAPPEGSFKLLPATTNTSGRKQCRTNTNKCRQVRLSVGSAETNILELKVASPGQSVRYVACIHFPENRDHTILQQHSFKFIMLYSSAQLMI